MEKHQEVHELYPPLGMGLGLRKEHYHHIIEHVPPVDWFEILTENYMVDGGIPLYYLDKIRENYPLVMHGVSLSIGSLDPLNMDYLNKVKQLANRIEPKWISDHLCWTGINQHNLHDLLPLPYTEKWINHVVERVRLTESTGEPMARFAILLASLLSYSTTALEQFPAD